jgi:hypothetical protein
MKEWSLPSGGVSGVQGGLSGLKQTLAMPSCDASDGASGRADVTRVSLAARVHCRDCTGCVDPEGGATDAKGRERAGAAMCEGKPQSQDSHLLAYLQNNLRDNISALVQSPCGYQSILKSETRAQCA